MNSPVNQNLFISRVPFVKLFAITLAYYSTGKLGLSVPYFGTHVTLFWLPSGIAVAALLRYGWRCWPAVYLGAFLVNLAVGSSTPLAMGVAISNTLAPIFTTWLLRRMHVDLAFNRYQDISLLCLAAALGMLVSAGGGVLMLWLVNVITSQAIVSVFASWWMGDFVGVLLVTPLLLAISRDALTVLRLKRSELIIWSVLAVVVTWLAFFAKFAGAANLPLAFLPLPLAVWAALRFGLLGATTSTLLLSFLAVLGTSFGGGPFHGVSEHMGLLLLWVYMVTLLITSLIVAALLAERNYAEILLKSSLAQTKLLLDASLDAVVNMNQSGIVTDWNYQAEKIFCYSQQQAIGRDLAELIVPPALRETHRNGLARFLKTKNPTIIGKRIEVMGMRADGAEFPIELTLAMLENQGKINFSAYIRDITERKQAENNLKVAATTFESQEGMMVTDANTAILRVNRAFTNITGYSAEEAIGQTPRLLSSGKQDKAFYMVMWRSLNSTGAWEGEIWNRRKSGEIYPEHLTITAVKDVAGIVTNYVATLTDITMSQAAADEIRSLAFYDPLTKLPNRRLLLDRLNQALAASARSGQRGALLFMDLDHFKALNDTLGHDLGDLLLQQVATRLTASVREGDTVARLGGDEFVVLLEDLSEEGIEAAAQTKDIAEKILLVLNQPYQLNTHTHHSTSSIGATVFNGHEQATDELLKQSDIAMYQSKAEGRNALRFFDPKMQEAITARVDMEKELRKAIAQHQFELHYQIQVGNAGQAIGAEALIRWQHPERGMISPFNFIPLAEETGLILPIGQWVLETACAQLKSWQQNPLTCFLVISINVSAKQFFQIDFVEQVLAAVQYHAINPTRLKLELTESLLVENINDIIAKMKVLNQAGIRFSLDDFGTGYSSLQYLKKLPLDQLKIDQSFVCDINQDTNDRAIVVTIINVAQGLDINVIAEGVETELQQQFLFDHGCTHFQGYLFGKPMPIGEFEATLERR